MENGTQDSVIGTGVFLVPDMKYRKFGKLDYKPSALGFGAMRLPFVGGDLAKIDEPQAIDMIRYAIDNGVNYVDSAYVYHRGQSEVLVGKALKDGYREKVKIATKLPCWLIKNADEFDKILNEQLQRLQTDHIDFYLLHGLGANSWPRIKDLGVFKWAEEKIKEGKIRHLGFSFHDPLPLFKEIVDAYDWDFCQIQYNYMDTSFQAGTEGLKYAAKKGLAVVVMEPIAGGRLAVEPPTAVKDLWAEGHHRWKPAEWALQWVWNHPEVSIVLSGMSSIEQVIENVKAAGRSGAGKLTKDDLMLVDRVAGKYREVGFIKCTGCRYCTPCPSGVAIPEVFSLVNEFFQKDRDPSVKAKYVAQLKQEQWANNCTSCGRCEELCPQHLPIRNLLREAHQRVEVG